jgi:hypothetical protein
MKSFLVSYFLLFFFISSSAHPPVGIVKDSKGNIYYTDLKHVWKVDPTTGKKIIVVPNVHTHELYMDTNGNLYGEHLWYNGEKANTWGYYVWCLKSDGSLVKIIEPTAGFRSDYSFVRDSSGSMYWIDRSNIARFMKKAPSGETTKFAEEKLGHVGWLYSTANGTLYFTEDNKLEKLTPDGKMAVVADNLGANTTSFTVAGRNYDGYGIWTDNADNVYIAMIGAKKVNRVSPDGDVKPILFTHSLWTACNGLFDDHGNLWLLEYSVTNECRTRKLSKEDLAKASTLQKTFPGRTHILATIICGLGVVLSYFLLKWTVSKQKLLQTLSIQTTR